MDTRALIRSRQIRRLQSSTTLALTLAGFLSLPGAGSAAALNPVVDLGFTESPGATTAANVGSLGGVGYYWQGDGSGYPMLSTSVPQGAFAPRTTPGRSTSARSPKARVTVRWICRRPWVLRHVGSLHEFHVVRLDQRADLGVGWGGNRILFALETPNGSGFDLVHLGDGSLQLGSTNGPTDRPR